MSTKAPKDFPRTTKGAMPKTVIDFLGKVHQQEINLAFTEDKIKIWGKGFKATFPWFTEITSPITEMKSIVPDQFQPVPEKLISSLKALAPFVSFNADRIEKECIHIAPKWAEVCDNYKIARCRCTWEFNSVLIPISNLKPLFDFHPSYVYMDAEWVYWSDSDYNGLLAMRHYTGDYPDLADYIKFKGQTVTFPATMKDIVEKAQLFKDDEDGSIQIDLKTASSKVSSSGFGGSFFEQAAIQYDGPPMSFNVNPKYLLQALKLGVPISIHKGKMKFVLDNLTVVLCLSISEE